MVISLLPDTGFVHEFISLILLGFCRQQDPGYIERLNWDDISHGGSSLEVLPVELTGGDGTCQLNLRQCLNRRVQQQMIMV